MRKGGVPWGWTGGLLLPRSLAKIIPIPLLWGSSFIKRIKRLKLPIPPFWRPFFCILSRLHIITICALWWVLVPFSSWWLANIVLTYLCLKASILTSFFCLSLLEPPSCLLQHISDLNISSFFHCTVHLEILHKTRTKITSFTAVSQ